MVIRVLIADDHEVLRAGLRALIDAQADMEVVCEVDRAEEVGPAARRLVPDVVLLDLSLPLSGGFETLEELRASVPGPKILILTMHEEPGYLQRAMALGASGYVIKAAAATRVLDGIRAVAAGQRFVDAGEGVSLPPEAAGDSGALARIALSPREQEVLRYVASGYTNRETADRLDLSVKTVEGYRARLMRKLDATSRVDLVRFAVRMGILEDDP